MENEIEVLVGEFESGKLTRRDLVRGLAAITTAAGLVSAISGDDVVEAGTGNLEDWQEALLTGIANLHFEIDTSAGWRIIPHGEPYDSTAHQNWLFDQPADGTNEPRCLNDLDRGRIQDAVKRVPQRNSPNPRNAEPPYTTGAGWIHGIIKRMRQCGAIEDAGTTQHVLYELVKKKIEHAGDHGYEDGLLDMAGLLYNATNDASVKAWVVEHGTPYYFNNEPGHEDDFRDKIHDRPKKRTEHDW